GRSVRVPGSGGHPPGHARQYMDRPENPARLRAENRESEAGQTGRFAPARVLPVFAVSPTRGNAPILAGFRVSRVLGAFRSPPNMVAAVPERLRWNRILARILFQARGHGSRVCGYTGGHRLPSLRSGGTGSGPD